MAKRKRTKYTDKFKAEAVKLIVEEGYSISQAARNLGEGNQMFATRIVEENPWYRAIIAPEGKSFFFRIVWSVIALIGVAVVIYLAMMVWADETLKKNLLESLNLFTEGGTPTKE